MVASSSAYQAMLDHHELLERELARRLSEVERGMAGGERELAAAKDEFLSYLGSDIFSHALAEEYTIYEAARLASELSGSVDELLQEHRDLEEAASQLRGAVETAEIGEIASEISGTFSRHVAKENGLLLRLLEREDADLGRLLAAMEELFGAAREPLPAGKRDLEGDLARLILDHAAAAAEAGLQDEAATVVAAAWALLQHDRPDLAAEAARRLHRIAGRRDTQPVSLRRSPDQGGNLPELDARRLAPARRHAEIFERYAALDPGTAFVLVNDHDPRPLRYQFEAEHAGEYSWEYLEAGPKVWRVRIGRR